MENASKALLIAGEILIAVLILGIIVYAYNNLSFFAKEQEEDTLKKQITAFNREYESYNRKLLRGVDVISVANKAISNNTKYENENYYYIQVEFEIIEAINVDGSKLDVGTYNLNYYSSNIMNNSSIFTELKRKVFDCTKLDYNNQSGRVNYMKFVERNVT